MRTCAARSHLWVSIANLRTFISLLYSEARIAQMFYHRQVGSVTVRRACPEPFGFAQDRPFDRLRANGNKSVRGEPVEP